ncbi:probable long-chain-alcohol O-fatty-acyltransferase 5 [Chenopodium quinoa]|uniref:probable long-chain-alcohol O-fatty-acyltransferase 5 n=1 Tax=Chenopodium quinoa TaxID=63459 RepID=UPI000B7797C5|nr:probable long-chain-alcohol O-fatty-acyltransferase 5 [Chenopodium quinoa]
MEEDEGKKFIKAWIIILASLCYSYFIASKIPKGILRFISLLPIFSLFTLLPLSLSRPLTNILFGGFIVWLANFKLLLYAFNHGPLSYDVNDDQPSLLRFIFLAAFPIKIKKVNPSTKGQEGNLVISPNKKEVVLPLNFWSKVVIFVILEVVYSYNKNMVAFCGLMYLAIDIAFGVCDFLVGFTLGIELEPPSNEPYLSTSLQDFWGRRWNLRVTEILHHTVYKPVRSTVVKFVGQKWAQVTGVMASFVVSGLMHELVYYYTTRAIPTWEVTWFFVLHGVCVVLEIGVKRTLGLKWKLHWAVSGPLTVGFVMVTGFWLFFPQLMRNEVDVKATQDIIDFGKYLKEMVMRR